MEYKMKNNFPILSLDEINKNPEYYMFSEACFYGYNNELDGYQLLILEGGDRPNIIVAKDNEAKMKIYFNDKFPFKNNIIDTDVMTKIFNKVSSKYGYAEMIREWNELNYTNKYEGENIWMH